MPDTCDTSPAVTPAANNADITIRASHPDDVAALCAIYNHYVEHSHATFDLHPKTEAERGQWLAGFDSASRRCISAVDRQGQVLGYACSGAFKAKPAYASSVEVSVYVAPDLRHHGVGHKLYSALFPLLDDAGVHRAYAGIALPNPGSLKLHQQHGFHEVGHYHEVGHKFGRYWDVVWLQRARQPV